MALRPLGLTVAAASSRAVSAQQSGVTSPLHYEGRVDPCFDLHPPPIPTMIK